MGSEEQVATELLRRFVNRTEMENGFGSGYVNLSEENPPALTIDHSASLSSDELELVKRLMAD